LQGIDNRNGVFWDEIVYNWVELASKVVRDDKAKNHEVWCFLTE